MKPKTKADKLIARFPVTDLAIALSRTGERRANFLRSFVDGFTTRSFRALREVAPLIYNAQPPLWELPTPNWSDIETKIRRGAGPHNADINIGAAILLKDLISRRSFKAILSSEQFIHVGPGRIVKIGLNYYIVEDGNVIFQFVQPRADEKIDASVARALMSLVHYAYVFGDFEDAVVEMADLSAVAKGSHRVPRFHRLNKTDLMTRNELNAEIDNVHGLLSKLARRH